ncbi:MAG: sialidase family protein [Phycisphaeraceae bacterium]
MRFDIQLDKVRSGFDGTYFWGQARAAVIPGDPPTGIITTQRALRTGSDVYYAIAELRSDDGGRTWHDPVEHTDTLGRRDEPGGWQVAICDMTPAWHAPSGKLLATGHTVRYLDDRSPPPNRARETAWTVYDPDTRTWSPWDVLTVPNEPRLEAQGAGCTQRCDLDDGTILLPTYGKPRSDDHAAKHFATVTRCAFNGTTLRYLEHGNLLSVPDPRGCCEPSLTRFQGRFYLTIRNDVCGYVATSDDGLHFSDPIPWTFDDGTELGNYNTQQHWVTHSDALHLVYTRKGLNNDHVFRHRAPLMIAQVDPDRLCVRRETERELVPNRGARLGNFGVCNATPNETWVVVSEWMQPAGCEQHGSDNTIWLARLKWRTPNALG